MGKLGSVPSPGKGARWWSERNPALSVRTQATSLSVAVRKLPLAFLVATHGAAHPKHRPATTRTDFLPICIICSSLLKGIVFTRHAHAWYTDYTQCMHSCRFTVFLIYSKSLEFKAYNKLRILPCYFTDKYSSIG